METVPIVSSSSREFLPDGRRPRVFVFHVHSALITCSLHARVCQRDLTDRSEPFPSRALHQHECSPWWPVCVETTLPPVIIVFHPHDRQVPDPVR